MWLVFFFGAAVLIAMTPGANNLLGMHHGMHHGPGKALAGLTGRLTAFAVLIAAVAAGLGPVLAASELALTVIKWAGVAYLLWLGGRILVRTFRGGGDAAHVEQDAAERSALLVARKEFLVAISNPKAILIFTAFVPQFITPDHGPIAAQVLLLGAVYLLAETVAGSAYIAVGAVVRSIRMTVRARRNLDRGTGLVLLGMAGVLAGSQT